MLEENSGYCQSEKESNEGTRMPPWRYRFRVTRFRFGIDQAGFSLRAHFDFVPPASSGNPSLIVDIHEREESYTANDLFPQNLLPVVHSLLLS